MKKYFFAALLALVLTTVANAQNSSENYAKYNVTLGKQFQVEYVSVKNVPMVAEITIKNQKDLDTFNELVVALNTAKLFKAAAQGAQDGTVATVMTSSSSWNKAITAQELEKAQNNLREFIWKHVTGKRWEKK